MQGITLDRLPVPDQSIQKFPLQYKVLKILATVKSSKNEILICSI